MSNNFKVVFNTPQHINAAEVSPISFTVDEITNLYIKLYDLKTDLDLYFGDFDPAKNIRKVWSSSTNDGIQSESIFLQLNPGAYTAWFQNNRPSDSLDPSYYNCIVEFDSESFGKTTLIGNDPLLSKQWHLFNTGIATDQRGATISLPNIDIMAPEAWKIRNDASSIIVAVIDGGIDISHPDLINNLWVNDEIPANGLDDDDNGLVDDVHGWNFGLGTSAINPDPHGTHVAGIIGASGNNSLGVSGVAWKTQLMTLDVDGPTGSPSTQAVTDAIYYAVNNGAKVINVSIGGARKLTPAEFLEMNSARRAALKYAYDNDVFISLSAGNDGSSFSDIDRWKGVGNLDKYATSDATYSDLFGNIANVAATSAANTRASYSNYGKTANISAPGGDFGSVQTGQDAYGQPVYTDGIENYQIYSTLPTAQQSYGYMAGTSMAAPVIAGMAALIRAEDSQITAPETLAILRAGATVESGLIHQVDQGLAANLYRSLELAREWSGPDTLTRINQDIAPIYNLSALTRSQQLKGSMTATQSDRFDVVTGFYKVVDAAGGVLDSIGNYIAPGDHRYSSIALNPFNIVDDLQIANSRRKSFASRSKGFSLSGTNILAPYARVEGSTWFAYGAANSDGKSHFKVLEPNVFGLQAFKSSGEFAFKDLIISFDGHSII